MANGKPTADDEWEDVPSKKSAGTATADEWEDVPADTSAAPAERDVDILPGATPRLRATAKKLTPPTRLEKETPKIPENYGFTPGNVLGSIYEGAKGVVGSTAQGLYDTILGEGKNEQGVEQHGLGGLIGLNAKGEFDPVGRLKWLGEKYITDPAAEEAKKARQLEDLSRQEQAAGTAGSIGHATEAVGHRIAAGVPLVGPWAAHLGERAGAGDIGGAGGEMAGAFAGGKMLEHPVETAKLPLRLADKVVRGTPLTEAGRLEAAKKQALTVKKPSMSETEYEQKFTEAIPDLQRIAQNGGAERIKASKQPERQAVTELNNRIAQMESPISQHLQTVPDAVQMQQVGHFAPEIETAMDNSFQRSGHWKPQEIEKAKNSVRELIGDQDKPLRTLDENRQRLNADADAYFSARDPEKRIMDVSDATAVAQKAAADWIRLHEYGDAQAGIPSEFERLGLQATDANGNPVSLRDVRRATGRLIDIRDHFKDAITRAADQGDWHPFRPLFTGPSIAAGGLGLAMGHIAGLGPVMGLLLGEGLKAWGDYLRTKNIRVNTRKMFRNLADTGKPNTVDVTATMPAPPAQPAPAVPFQHQVGAPAPPPPVPAAHAVQFPGTLGNVGGQLGARGQGGVRIAGQLPTPTITPRFVREIPAQPLGRAAPQLPAPAVPPETNIPPIVEPQFAREEVQPLATAGERAPESQLGTVGRQGIRTTPAAELPKKVPAHAIQDKIERLQTEEADLRRNGYEGAANAKRVAWQKLEEQVPEGFEETPPQKNLGTVGGPGRGGILGKVNKETELPKKKVNTEEEGIPYTKPMPVPASKVWAERGVTAESVLHHELAHLVLSGIDGFVSNGVSSHRHPLSKGSGATASVLFPRAQFRDPVTGGFDADVVKNKGTQLADLFAAGAASDELLHGIDRKNNPGLYGDKRLAKELFKALDVPEDQHDAMFDAAVDRAKERLQHPGIVDLMKREASIREEGLPVEFHFSKNRAENIVRKAKGLYEQRVTDQGAGAAAGYPGSEETVSAGEKAGAGEPAAVAARKEKIKPFTPPKNIYTFKIEGLPGAAEDVYTTREALTRRKAFDQIIKDVPGAGMYRMIKEEAPPVENIPFTQKAEEFKPEDLDVSTRTPSSPRATENGHTHRLLIDMDALKNSPPSRGETLFDKMHDIIKTYPGMERVIRGAKTSEEAVNRYIDHLSSNLEWLYNKAGNTRDITRQWYDSAHHDAKNMADRHGYTHQQAAGVVATQSPNKDWFMNRSLANRIMDVYRNQQDTVTTPEMESKMKELDRVETVNKIKGTLDKVRGKLSDAQVDKVKTLADNGYRTAALNLINRAAKTDFAVPQHTWKLMAKDIGGKSLKDLPDSYRQGAWIRAFDEAHNSKSFEEMAPNGEILGNVKNIGGEDSRVAWNSLPMIEKAVNILKDGSRENISRQLGEEHKVRNFYNNIIDPDSKNPHVTVDTHAVAAAHLSPYSGTSVPVSHNFGAPGSDVTGAGASYAVNAEAYRRAAQRLGVKPRELQSITWEQIRDLFPDTFKTEKNRGIIKDIWERFGRGEINLEKARNQVVQAAGGFHEPSWLSRIRRYAHAAD